MAQQNGLTKRTQRPQDNPQDSARRGGDKHGSSGVQTPGARGRAAVRDRVGRHAALLIEEGHGGDPHELVVAEA